MQLELDEAARLQILKQVKQIREREGLSYYELGLRCGLPEPTIRRALQGSHRTENYNLFKMREYLSRRRRAQRRRRQATEGRDSSAVVSR
jgi:hypothetical protein